jgi:hypothetical protein
VRVIRAAQRTQAISVDQPGAPMKIHTLLETWARDCNRKVRSAAWFKISVVLALAAATAFALGYTLVCNVLFVALVVLAIRNQKKFVLLNVLLAEDGVVPDPVLGLIADEPMIPTLLKRQIAVHLDRHGVINFSTLAVLEKGVAENEDRLARIGGEGFRKISTYATRL